MDSYIVITLATYCNLFTSLSFLTFGFPKKLFQQTIYRREITIIIWYIDLSSGPMLPSIYKYF